MKTKWTSQQFVLAAVSLLLMLAPPQAVTAPLVRDWKQLETSHFTIVYDHESEELAQDYALEAEKAFTQLTAIMPEAPQKIVIVLDDASDLANGSAAFLPYPMIKVFPVLPDANDWLSFYDKWGSTLMLHELAHILIFEPAHGMYSPFRYIFGRTVTPNGLLPRWYHEGLAVAFESALSGTGRLRSPRYQATVRALVEEGRLRPETIDRINETTLPSWPFGTRPYFFGALLWNELLNEKGLSAANELTQAHGRRLPFLLNPIPRAATGKDYEGWLDQTYDRLERETKSQLKDLSELAIAMEDLGHSGTGHIAPMISPNGRYLAYIAYVPKEQSEIRLVDRGPESGTHSFLGRPVSTVHRGYGFSRISWHPSGKGFVFDQLTTVDHDRSYRDLFFYDLDRAEFRRLTTGARASQGAFSPAGREIAFISQSPGRTHLELLDIETGQRRRLFSPPLHERISHPEFLNQDQIVGAWRRVSGEERLFRLDIKTGQMKSLPALGHHPHLTSRGLSWISDPGGVPNLFVASAALGDPRPVTQVTTEVMGGTWDPLASEWLISRLSGRGPRLYRQREPVAPLKIPLVAEAVIRDPPPAPTAPAQAALQAPLAPQPYSSWRYLAPNYWIPFLYPVDNGLLVEGITGSTDPLGHNRYSLSLRYDTVTAQLGSGLDWSYRFTQFQLGSQLYYFPQYLPADGLVIENQGASAAASFYLLPDVNRMRGSLGLAYSGTKGGTRDLEFFGPRLSWNLSSKDPNDPVPSGFREDRWSLGLNHTEWFGLTNHTGYGRSTLDFHQSLESFLPAQHTLWLRLGASFAPRLAVGDIILLGDKTVGGRYTATLLNSSYLMRGYISGEFVGRTLAALNAEYEFPLSDLYVGSGTLPVFLRELRGRLFLDGISVDGAYYDNELPGYRRSRLDRSFWGTGTELILTSTVAYNAPLSVTLGLYYGLNEEAWGGFNYFLGLGLGNLIDPDGAPRRSSSQASAMSRSVQF